MNYPRTNYPDLARIDRERAATELALAAIYAVLFPQGEEGWNDWNRYAANGEWI